jgi:hypothetical protein
MFLDELAKNGVECRMGEFMDEAVLTRRMAKSA